MNTNKKNKAPTAIYKAVAPIVLPLNSITLDLSGSTDPDRNIKSYSHTKISGPACTITNPKSKLATISGMLAGTYVFEGKVTDWDNAYSTARITVTVTMPPAPIAFAGSPQTIQLPGTLKLRGSASGTGITTVWSKNGVDFSTELELDLTSLTAGVTAYTLTVKDQYGRTAISTVDVTILPVPPPVPVKWGAKIAGLSADDKITVMKNLGLTYMRLQQAITTFNGAIPMLDKMYAAGIKVILNIDYEDQPSGNTALTFVTDLNLYKAGLIRILDKYADKIEVAVCENEPTTEVFYSGPMTDYTAMLKVFAEVCKSYGVKCTDGGTHPENILQIMSNVSNPSKNVEDVRTILNAIKTIPELTYVNMHAQGQGSSYPAGQIKKVGDWLTAYTGKPVMSNEWHVEGATASLIKDMVQQFKDGRFFYSCIWGTSKAGDTINNGTALTDLGTAFAAAIK